MRSRPPLRVMFVGARPAIRERVRPALASGGFDVRPEVRGAGGPIAAVRRLPDACVIDAEAFGDSREVAEIGMLFPGVPVIIVTDAPSESSLIHSLQSGAAAYLDLTSLGSSALAHAVRSALGGVATIASSSLRRPRTADGAV